MKKRYLNGKKGQNTAYDCNSINDCKFNKFIKLSENLSGCILTKSVRNLKKK